jgi:hypothetical protein
MATFNRVNGNSIGVVNVDAGYNQANAKIINTGIAAPLSAVKITGLNGDSAGAGLGLGNLAAELGSPNGSGVSGAVETILRAISANASILAYQVDANAQLSVLLERSSWSDATLLASLPTGNIGAYGNCYVGGGTAVSSTGGIKLA